MFVLTFIRIRDHFEGKRVRTASPLLKCLRTSNMYYIAILQDFAYISSKFFRVLYPRIPAVFGSRHPLGARAFPLFLFYETTTYLYFSLFIFIFYRPACSVVYNRTFRVMLLFVSLCRFWPPANEECLQFSCKSPTACCYLPTRWGLTSPPLDWHQFLLVRGRRVWLNVIPAVATTYRIAKIDCCFPSRFSVQLRHCFSDLILNTQSKV